MESYRCHVGESLLWSFPKFGGYREPVAIAFKCSNGLSADYALRGVLERHHPDLEKALLEIIHQKVVVPLDVDQKFVQPPLPVPVGGLEPRYGEEVGAGDAVPGQDVLVEETHPGIGRDENRRLESREVEGLAGRDDRHGVLPADGIDVPERLMFIAGHQDVAVQLVREHPDAVFGADVAEALQILPAPDPPCEIMGAAQDEEGCGW